MLLPSGLSMLIFSMVAPTGLDKCRDLIELSQREYDRTGSAVFHATMWIEERHYPAPQEQAESVVVDATLSAINSDNTTASSVIDALIGSTVSSRSTRVFAKHADVIYHDGLWRLVETTEDSWLELDGNTHNTFSNPIVNKYHYLDDMVVSQCDGLTSFNPAGFLDHILISSVLLGDYIASDLLIDGFQCQSLDETVSVTIQTLGNTMLLLLDALTGRVRSIDTTLAGGGRVTMTREYGDGVVADLVTLRHFAPTGRSGDALIYERRIRIESEKVDGLPYFRPVIEDGAHVVDHRSRPTLTYQYNDACAVTASDLELVSSLRRAIASYENATSCGAVCAAGLVKLRGGDVAEAIAEAMTHDNEGLMSLQAIVDTCRAMSVQARAIKVAPERIASTQFPAVLHLNTSAHGHFVICLGGGDGHLKILDPLDEASAINVVPIETIQRAMSGYGVELTD